jgi:hypothetical protein
VLCFIELDTRRVHLARVTAHPEGARVTQQAHNPRLVLGERAHECAFLVRDRDAKLTRAFDDVFGSDHADVLSTPVPAPNANACAERWIRRVRAQCLDWLLIGGRGHLRRCSASTSSTTPATVPTGRSDWSHRMHRPVQSSSATTRAVCSDATGSAVCSTSTGKLHERISAPHG